MKKYTLGSLFDGISAFPVAAERNGIKTVWASEIDPAAIKVSQLHYPNMEQLGDISRINGAEIEPVGITTFGSPCQDMSVAGKREGLNGERSGLFRQAIRIIQEMQAATGGQYPRFAVWENVLGAFSSNKGLDFRTVLEEITGAKISMPKSGRWAKAGLVRSNNSSVAWRMLDAQYWGVPQRRKRIFLIADFRGQCAGEILFKPESLSRNTQESKGKREKTAGSVEDSIRAAGFKPRNSSEARSIGYEEELGPTLSTSNNEAVIQVMYGFRGERDGLDSTENISPTLMSCEGAGSGCKMAVAFPNVVNPLLNKGNLSYRMDMDNVAVDVYDMTHADEVMRPVESGRVQTLNARMGTGGNQVPVIHIHKVAAIDCRNLSETENISGTLQSKSNGGYSLNYQNPVRIGYAVRRLTPTECERLQGFPDGWTAGLSDTGRYKTLGNSIAIPCAEYVMSGIKKAIDIQAIWGI